MLKHERQSHVLRHSTGRRLRSFRGKITIHIQSSTAIEIHVFALNTWVWDRVSNCGLASRLSVSIASCTVASHHVTPSNQYLPQVCQPCHCHCIVPFRNNSFHSLLYSYPRQNYEPWCFQHNNAKVLKMLWLFMRSRARSTVSAMAYVDILPDIASRWTTRQRYQIRKCASMSHIKGYCSFGWLIGFDFPMC